MCKHTLHQKFLQLLKPTDSWSRCDQLSPSSETDIASHDERRRRLVSSFGTMGTPFGWTHWTRLWIASSAVFTSRRVNERKHRQRHSAIATHTVVGGGITPEGLTGGLRCANELSCLQGTVGPSDLRPYQGVGWKHQFLHVNSVFRLWSQFRETSFLTGENKSREKQTAGHFELDLTHRWVYIIY